MKKTKCFFTRLAVWTMICLLAVLSCTAAFADGETRTVNGQSRRVYWRTYGNGEEISIFQVAVNSAPATICFEQEEGLCYENSYTHFIDGSNGVEEEWGKYHVYYRMTGDNTIYHQVWDKTRRGGSYEIYLNYTGTYCVWLVPYTAQEMTDSWTLDTFVSWNRTPKWRVSSYSSGTYITGEPYKMNQNGTLTNTKIILNTIF